jgi:hypothetical protein
VPLLIEFEELFSKWYLNLAKNNMKGFNGEEIQVQSLSTLWKLLFNFAYASWNGPGYFKKFAKKVNDSVSMGITNPEELDNMVYAMRTIRSGKIKNASEMLA